MRNLFIQFRDFFVSLKLTVVLLALSIVLIFAATLDQMNIDAWAAQAKYFRTFFVLWHAGDIPVPVFPGGYILGGLLFLNLVSAHLYRFKMSWRKSGIFLTHIGVILLLVGELLTGLWQREYQMALVEGETKGYSESVLKNEFAVINATDPAFDDVVAIPESIIAKGGTIQNPKFPFSLVIKEYFPNADFFRRSDQPNAPPSLADQGVGTQIVALPAPLTYKPRTRNIPTAYIQVMTAEGSIGTWLFRPNDPDIPALDFTARFEYAGKTWRLLFRPQRSYHDFTVTLHKVTNDIYAGTDIPKNFSSLVSLSTPSGPIGGDRLIYMNHPLRYDGLTFYQEQMDAPRHLSVFQVVRNPSWQLPYLSCALVALGLIVQFGIHLFGFFGKRRAAAAAPKPVLKPSTT